MDTIKEILVGIDFGTSNTVLSYFSANKAIIIKDGIFKTIPSKIAKIDGKLYCGNYIPINSENIIHSFKTSIGENILFKFTNDLSEYEYTDTELLIIFFSHLFDLIIKNLQLSEDSKIIKTVITVPSNFNDKQREIIKSCFISVGFNVIRIINEPSAAALAYGLSHSSKLDDVILVIDTGGGTMDFTVLEKTDLFFEVIHSEGLNNLGGNNFTQLIYDDIIQEKIKDVNEIIVWNQAQKIKEKLSYLDIYEIKNSQFNYVLTRNRFNDMAKKYIIEIEQILSKIIESYEKINWVVLVGGTSRICILQEIIKKKTKLEPWIHPNLESVVSEGACLYAGIIENKFISNDDVVLMDVLPLSLGVELADGSYSIIVPKNTPLPIKRTQKYTIDTPGDTTIKIKVYQGERPIANKNFLIGEFLFDKISAGGVPIIEISFRIDLNSIINIIITDRKSGIEKSIILKDIPQLNNDELENIISQAQKLVDVDEIELAKASNIYIINSYIENILINLSINDKINDKNIILDKIKQIEEKIDSMNNLQLIETITYLQDNFSLMGTNNIDNSDDINNIDQVEKMFLNELKEDLINKIKLLLAVNPDWDEFLNPVLEELSYNNVSIDYVNEKIKLLNELDNNNEKNYKQELNNLCLYLKSELENGSIDLGNEKNILLINIINENLENITKNYEDSYIDWKYQLEILNKKCDEIYSN